MRRLVPVALIVGLTLAACDGDKQVSAATSPSDNVASPDSEQTAAKGPDAIEGKAVDGDTANPVVKEGEAAGEERYALSIVPPDGTAACKEGVVKIKVLPKGPWHINLDYPTKLTVNPPAGVELAKAEQKKADAISLTDDTCEFDVAFTSSDAGDKSFTGKFKFAICQDEACAPVSEDIEFTVAVK